MKRGYDNNYKGLTVPNGHASIFYGMDEDKRLADLCKANNEKAAQREKALKQNVIQQQPDLPIQNPPLENNQNQGLQQALQRIQELERELIQSDQAKLQAQQEKNQAQQETETLRVQVVEKDNIINTKINTIEDQSARIIGLQGRLLNKTEESNANNIKFIEEQHKADDFKHKIDLYKTHFNGFIEQHEDIDGYDQLVGMLGDLNIEQV